LIYSVTHNEYALTFSAMLVYNDDLATSAALLKDSRATKFNICASCYLQNVKCNLLDFTSMLDDLCMYSIMEFDNCTIERLSVMCIEGVDFLWINGLFICCHHIQSIQPSPN